MLYKKFIFVMIISVFLANYSFAQFPQNDLNKKPTVVVLDFKLITSGSITEREVLVLSSKFRSSIIKTNKFSVLERENVEEILNEHNFSIQDFANCSGGQCAIQLGGLLSAQKIIIGDIGKVGETYSITARIINTSDGKVEEKGTVDEKYKGKTEGLIKVFGVIAKKLSGTYKPWWRWSNIWNYVIGAVIGGAGYYGYNEFVEKGNEDSDFVLPIPPKP